MIVYMKLIQRPVKLSGNFNFRKTEPQPTKTPMKTMKGFPQYWDSKDKGFIKFDRAYAKKSYINHLAKNYEDMDYYGVGANGYRKSTKEKENNLRIKLKKHQEKNIDLTEKEEDINEQEQLNSNGPEAQGLKKIDEAKAKAEVKVRMKKHNRGNLANNLTGLFASGMRRRQYEKETIREDNDYEETIKADEEFMDLDEQIENEYYETTSMKRTIRDN